MLPLGPVKMTPTFSRCREKPGPREIKGKITSQNVKTVLPEECTGGGAGVRPGRAPRGGANRPSHNRKHPFQNFRNAGVKQNHFSLWTTGPGCRRRRLPLMVSWRHAVEAAEGSVRVVSRHALIQNAFFHRVDEKFLSMSGEIGSHSVPKSRFRDDGSGTMGLLLSETLRTTLVFTITDGRGGPFALW